MTPKIGQFLGKTVHVSIPALFGDGACRPYRLLGVELQGMWLQSDELSARLLSEETRELANAMPVVFVPFAHIAGVLVPTTPPTEPPPGGGSGDDASLAEEAGACLVWSLSKSFLRPQSTR